MPSDSQIAQARYKLAKLRGAHCTIGPFTEATDPTTLLPIRTIGDPHYSGPFKLRDPSGDVSERTAASQQVAAQGMVLSLPVVESASVEVGDLVVIDTNPRDPALVGAEFRVAGIHASSDSTARRVRVETFS